MKDTWGSSYPGYTIRSADPSRRDRGRSRDQTCSPLQVSRISLSRRSTVGTERSTIVRDLFVGVPLELEHGDSAQVLAEQFQQPVQLVGHGRCELGGWLLAHDLVNARHIGRRLEVRKAESPRTAPLPRFCRF